MRKKKMNKFVIRTVQETFWETVVEAPDEEEALESFFNGENIVNETKEIHWEAEEVLSVEKFVNKEKKIVNG